jgi:hypothetical protein
MDKFRQSVRERLAAFLPRALTDGVLDETEKRELRGMLTSGVLTRGDVQEIFGDFLRGVHNDILQDGAVSAEERERLRSIVRELRIPHDFLPPEMARIVGER